MNLRLFLALLCTLFFPFVFTFAQDDEEEKTTVYELNPFNVDESGNLGYTATNTLSGTRFNSSLRDTSASVSVWTQEFIDDTGLTEIDELIDYSLNTVLDTNDQDGAGGNFNVFTNATAVTQRIRTRGVESSRGIDYFKAITPDDSYKIGRYDDSRGPNGVLFGVSAAGGIINQTSLVANTYQDSGRVRYSFGSFSRDRAEFRYNKVIIEDKLAVVVAGLNQDNGHWRDWVQQDKERIYAAMTWRPTEKITLRANIEDGFEHRTSLQQSPITDFGLPYYDYLQAGTPLEDLLFNPYRGNGQGARVTNATRAFGVFERDGNPRGFSGNGNNRFTFIENDGSFINKAGSFGTGGYNQIGIVPVDGSPTWPDDSVPNPPRNIRINDESVLPYHLNPGGPDFYRESDFSSYSLFADIQPKFDSCSYKNVIFPEDLLY
jgi:outer membrane receptor protein involved in Fe transport